MAVESDKLDFIRLPITIDMDNSADIAGRQPFLSDRRNEHDTFMFLVNEARTLEIPGRLAPLKRGLIVSNSEVGEGKLRFLTFLYDCVCDNRRIWGMRNQFTLEIVHSRWAPGRVASDLAPRLEAFVNASSAEDR
jgi:hypothetical protein